LGAWRAVGFGMIELMPNWTSGGAWTLGRDPLGIQATSVRMYRSLVPGLTNVTNRLRYYSFYCWVIERYEATEHSGDAERWSRFIRRAEALFALGCNLSNADEADGLAGNIWARKVVKGLPSGSFDIRPATDDYAGPGQYLGAKRGNFGQFYIASMTEEKFLAPSATIPIVSASVGRRAAAAFRDAVGDDADRLLAAIRDGAIDIGALTEIGHAIHPSHIPPESEEMALLRAYLLAEGEELTANAKARRASCWLLLDLLSKGVASDDEAAQRRAFYNRALPNGAAYAPPGQIAHTWRAYQANELCHIALEALLNALVARLQVKLTGEDPDTLIAEMIEPILNNLGASAAIWQDWATAVGVDMSGEEDALAETILDILADDTRPLDQTGLESAVQLIAVLWARWGEGGKDVRETIQSFAGRTGRSLAGVIGTLNTHAQASTAHALAQMLRRHVIADHLAIAGRKLAASGTFTYHFTSADGALADGRVATYGYTNPRLQNLIRFLRDSGLHDGTIITPLGQSFLHACQPV
jgi:hypothetical protein